MSMSAAGQDHPGDDLEERDPGLARERTSLAWTRTALSFAALSGAVLKANIITGLIILAVAPLIWQLGHISRGRPPDSPRPADPTAPAGPANSALPAGPALPADPAGPALPVVGATRLFIITLAVVAVSLLCLIVAILGPADPGALR
jgi:Domain of unknown function (DUF202)